MRFGHVLAWLAVVLGWAILIGFAGGYLFSGRLAAGAFVAAVNSRNMTDVVHGVDAPRLRAAAADDWSAMVPSTFKLPGLGSLANELRIAVNLGLRNIEVDDPTMADMLGHLLTGHGLVTTNVVALVPSSIAAVRTPVFGYMGGLSGDHYLLTVQFSETGEQVTATFERRGLFTWRVVRVQANSPSAFWPFRIPR